jgi:hypothetical protein
MRIADAQGQLEFIYACNSEINQNAGASCSASSAKKARTFWQLGLT